MCKVVVMDLLPLSLLDFWKQSGGVLSLGTMTSLSETMLRSLEFVHGKRLCHNDVKPDNFMFAYTGELQLIDFGLSSPYWLPKEGRHHRHVKCRQGLLGSARYASINSHEGFTLSRKDDLIAFAYVLVHLITGSLPWKFNRPDAQGQSKDDKYAMIWLLVLLWRHIVSPYFVRNG